MLPLRPSPVSWTSLFTTSRLGGGLIEAATSSDPLSTRLRQAREGIAQVSAKAQLGDWDAVRQAVSFTLPFLSLKGASHARHCAEITAKIWTGQRRRPRLLCLRHLLRGNTERAAATHASHHTRRGEVMTSLQ